MPGAFDAWMLLLRDYGTLPLADVMAPAIGYAERGCPMPLGAVQTIAAARQMIAEHWPSTAALFLPGGRLPQPGALYRNPALAETWKRLVSEAEAAGPDRVAQIDAARGAWYEGFVAEAVARFCREAPHRDSTGRDNGGLLTEADMAGWRAHYEAPAALDYRGHRIFKCGPWSQGPVLLQALAILEGVDVAGLDPFGADFVHTATEAMKLAYADREVYYGDPDFVDVPLETLLSADYAAERRRLLGETASEAFRPGEIDGYPWRPDYAAAAARAPDASLMASFGGGEPTAGPGGAASAATHAGDTCHLDVADAAGNLVSATPSGGWLQSSPVIPELGFALGTRLQMAWLDADAPSALAPGRRPRTTLTPSLAYRDGRPYMAFGTPGGDQQDQMQLIMLLRHIDHGLPLQQCIDAPAFHSEHIPSSFYPRHARPRRLVAEDRFGTAVIEALRARGHDIQAGAPWSEGRLSAAAFESDGTIRGAANPRGMQGYAVGR